MKGTSQGQTRFKRKELGDAECPPAWRCAPFGLLQLQMHNVESSQCAVRSECSRLKAKLEYSFRNVHCMAHAWPCNVDPNSFSAC